MEPVKVKYSFLSICSLFALWIGFIFLCSQQQQQAKSNEQWVLIRECSLLFYDCDRSVIAYHRPFFSSIIITVVWFCEHCDDHQNNFQYENRQKPMKILKSMQFDVFMPHLTLCYLYFVHYIHLLKRRKKKQKKNFDQHSNFRLNIGSNQPLRKFSLWSQIGYRKREEKLLNENSEHNNHWFVLY